MSYQQLCLLAQQANSPYTCCVGCIRSNGTRPFHFCKRTYRANYQEEDEETEEEDSSDEEEDVPPMPAPIKRQTTQWVVDGEVFYNGNPNGDRLLSTTTTNIDK
jgi:hypothetical protein